MRNRLIKDFKNVVKIELSKLKLVKLILNIYFVFFSTDNIHNYVKLLKAYMEGVKFLCIVLKSR